MSEAPREGAGRSSADSLESGRAGALAGVTLLSGFQVARMLVRAFLLVLVLRYFGPSLKGLIDVALAAYAVASLAQLQTGQFLQTVLPEQIARGHRWSSRVVLWQAYALDAASQLLLSVATVLLAGPVAEFYQLPEMRPLMYILGFGNLVFLLRSPISRPALLALKDYRRSVVIDALQLAGEVAATLTVVAFGLGPRAYLLLLVLAPGAGFAYGWAHYFRHVRPHLHGAAPRPEEMSRRWWLRSAFSFTGVVSLSSALYALHQRMGVLVAARYFSTSVVAYYTLSVSIVALVWGIASLSESVLLPLLSRAQAEGRAALERLLDRGWRAMFAFAAVLACALAAYPTEIIWLAGGNEFMPAVASLALLSLYPIFNAPDTTRFLFYLRQRPIVTLRWYALIVVGELGTYLALGSGLGIEGFVLARVVWRLVFAFAITRAAMRELHGEGAGPPLERIWRVVALAVLVLGIEHVAVLALLTSGLPLPLRLAATTVVFAVAAGLILRMVGGLEEIRRILAARQTPAVPVARTGPADPLLPER